MSSIAFLLDQHIPPAVASAMLTAEPSIDVRIVGQVNAPPNGTLDPDLLLFAEANSLVLVTFDKTSMPGHIVRHLSAGRHTSGVFIFPDSRLRPGRIAEELLLFWGASTAEEWVDQTVYLPYPPG